MLVLGSSFGKFSLLSLRTGSAVGTVIGHVINPHRLSVDALWCKATHSKKPLLLMKNDIREISMHGVLIDDVDVLTEPEDTIRLKPILDLQFELLDKKVISGKIPLGRVADYALDRDSLLVQKLYIAPAIWKKIKSDRLIVSRSQIVEVSHAYVKVKGSEVKSKQSVSRTQANLSPSASLSASKTSE